MKLYIKAIVFIILIQLFVVNLSAQEITKNIEEMTREEILNIPYDELIELPLEQLLKLADIVGVSLEELYEMILNKDIVAASKTEESSFESPLSTTVISGDELRNAGATSIPDALRMAPGIIVREKTPGNYDVHIRGNDNLPDNHMLLYSENSLSLIMIDNMPVYNYGHGGTFWELFPIDVNDIDRIEVIRGPASALYGPNAASGAINIVTLKPEKENLGVTADIQYGTPSTTIANGSVSFVPNNKLSVRLSGNYQKRERWNDDFYVWKYAGDVVNTSFESGYYDRTDEVFTMLNPGTGIAYGDSSFDIITNPEVSIDKYGVNAFLYYTLNEDANFSVHAGHQNSTALTTIIGDGSVPLTQRLSESDFLNFNGNMYGFTTQLSYNWGYHNVENTTPGMEHDIKDLSFSLEYDFNKIKNLSIRPGISYKDSKYTDLPYASKELPTDELVLFNAENQINALAFSLRLDYTVFEKLRLIAAMRHDTYLNPDQKKLSYQFVGSYKINDKNMLRAVYSRAHRAPFMADTYAEYYYPKAVSGDRTVTTVTFFGNEDVELFETDMFELGYRMKPVKNIQASIEAFYNKGQNYGYYKVDTVRATYFADNVYGVPTVVPNLIGLRYGNLDMVSKQMGLTIEIDWVVSQKFIVSMFETWQKTVLDNYFPYSPDRLAQLMLADVANLEYVGITSYPIIHPVTGQQIDAVSGVIMQNGNPTTTTQDSVTHKSTPTFYGGGNIIYKPIDKIDINLGFYHYGKQTFNNKNASIDINSKNIFNLKLNYKFYNENAVYVNVRNLLGNKDNEFAFTDEIGRLVMLGLKVDF